MTASQPDQPDQPDQSHRPSFPLQPERPQSLPAATGPADAPIGIGDVTQITGLGEATLRVWERRYSFPRSQRTAGGHRQFMEREVIQLQWVKLQLDRGVRASRAVQALHQTSSETAVAATLREPLPPRWNPSPALLSTQSELQYALLTYDSLLAHAILTEAAARHPLDALVLDVVCPTLSAIGESWSAGDIAVATEHFASHFLRHQLLQWIRTSPPPFHVNPVVLACAPDELHEGSLLMLAVLLRQLRWPVLYLGQSLPLEDLPALTIQVDPPLIVFVAMTAPTAIALARWPLWLPHQTETQRPIIGYGGAAFTADAALAQIVPGTLLGNTIDEGATRIHRLMLNLNALEPIQPTPPTEDRPADD